MSIDSSTWTPDLNNLVFSLDLTKDCACKFEAIVVNHYLDEPIRDAEVMLFMTTLCEDRDGTYFNRTLVEQNISLEDATDVVRNLVHSIINDTKEDEYETSTAECGIDTRD